LFRWGGEGVLLSQQGQRHRIFVHKAIARFGTDRRDLLRGPASRSISSSSRWGYRSPHPRRRVGRRGS
jgi:hypothetical protein